MLHLAPIDAKACHDLEPVERLQRANRRIAVLARKHITETLAQAPDGFRVGVGRYWTATPIAQYPQIIDPVTVIGVVVGPENRIHAIDPIRQQLRAAIGRGVDEKPFSLVALYRDRHPCAAVSRLVRIAVSPIAGSVFAPDTRHAR